MAAEEESLARGEARIKFQCNWLGNLWEHILEKELLKGVAKKLASTYLFVGIWLIRERLRFRLDFYLMA